MLMRVLVEIQYLLFFVFHPPFEKVSIHIFRMGSMDDNMIPYNIMGRKIRERRYRTTHTKSEVNYSTFFRNYQNTKGNTTQKMTKSC